MAQEIGRAAVFDWCVCKVVEDCLLELNYFPKSIMVIDRLVDRSTKNWFQWTATAILISWVEHNRVACYEEVNAEHGRVMAWMVSL